MLSNTESIIIECYQQNCSRCLAPGDGLSVWLSFDVTGLISIWPTGYRRYCWGVFTLLGASARCCQQPTVTSTACGLGSVNLDVEIEEIK